LLLDRGRELANSSGSGTPVPSALLRYRFASADFRTAASLQTETGGALSSLFVDRYESSVKPRFERLGLTACGNSKEKSQKRKTKEPRRWSGQVHPTASRGSSRHPKVNKTPRSAHPEVMPWTATAIR
jgi:hypothetical protein